MMDQESETLVVMVVPTLLDWAHLEHIDTLEFLTAFYSMASV